MFPSVVFSDRFPFNRSEVRAMMTPLSRRRFLKSGVAGFLGVGATWPALARTARAAAGGPDFCVTLCNHWSYIGIGWQLGIESCVLSVTDAMEMADRQPHVKTCINLDARAYEFMAEKFPEVAAKLAKYLAAGKVELIGGTYGQPMGTTISGESNIRQIVVGRETIRKALGYEMVTFLEEEEFTHPQVPQIGRPGRVTATPAWPSWTPGAGRAARARSSTPFTGKGSTARRSLRAEERPVRLSRPT